MNKQRLYYICMMYKLTIHPSSSLSIHSFIHLALLYKSQLAALAHAIHSPLPFPSHPPKPCVQIFIHASIASMGAKHSHEIKNMQSLRNSIQKWMIYFVSRTAQRFFIFLFLFIHHGFSYRCRQTKL